MNKDDLINAELARIHEKLKDGPAKEDYAFWIYQYKLVIGLICNPIIHIKPNSEVNLGDL